MSERRRLDGWKEIASYLGVAPRTARRWFEKKGLPIKQRNPKAPVHAFADELDQWLQRPKQVAQPVRWWRRPSLVGIALLLLLGGGLYDRSSDQCIPSSWLLESNLLTTLDDRGNICWQRSVPEMDAYYRQNGLFQGAAGFYDLNLDGAPEFLFNVFPPDVRESAAGYLLAFALNGSDFWRLDFERFPSFPGDQLTQLLEGKKPVLVAGPAGQLLVVTAIHRRYPSVTHFVDPASGKLLDKYVHPGHLSSLYSHDFDADGIEEIILGGINNPGRGLGHPAVAVLKLPLSQRNVLPDSPLYPTDFTGGREFKYFLFPRTDMSDALQKAPYVSGIGVVNGQIHCRVKTDPDFSVKYVFDLELKHVRLHESSSAVEVHQHLFNRGILDHELTPDEIDQWTEILPFPTAPDANSPSIRTMFHPRAPR